MCESVVVQMNEVIVKGYLPGAIGRWVELHGTYYHQDWGFGLFFEARVASDMSEFFSRYDPSRDGCWLLLKAGRVEGGIAIDGIHAETAGAHLRWFIVSPELRGRGFGNRLLEEAISFCRAKRYPKIYLHTFEGLHAARHLYEKLGFRRVMEAEGTRWGTRVIEQRFELIF